MYRINCEYVRCVIYSDKGGIQMKGNRAIAVGILLGIAVLLCGCAGSNQYMRLVSETKELPVPSNNEAMVVFMRPSGLGYAVSSSVFDINDTNEDFVGIVSAKKKVVYKTNPGEHMFMVIGETADFMRANLQSGKTYYALVTPRMGNWKARFSLKPVSKGELSSGEYRDWLNSCELTENTPEAFQWAKDNSPSIRSKRAGSWIIWNAKPESDKPTLNLVDCL
jgi:hypothetical protein